MVAPWQPDTANPILGAAKLDNLVAVNQLKDESNSQQLPHEAGGGQYMPGASRAEEFLPSVSFLHLKDRFGNPVHDPEAYANLTVSSPRLPPPPLPGACWR
jgi:hypothetical protein